METKARRLIPLMLIDDKSRYITHENNKEDWVAAANELGECLKNAMADCYAGNTLTKEAYISNIQKYIGAAVHKLTFEPDMEVTLVDQYGRPWSEVGSNQSMKSPLTGDRTLSEIQTLLNPLGIGIAPLNEDINPIPFEYIIDYYKQIKNGVENPNIDILSLGKGPLSYEGAKSYIENDPRYMLLLNNGSNPLLLPEVELLSPLPKEEKTLIESESIKSELDDSNWISTARYEKVTVTTIDENIDLTLGFGLVSIGHTQKVTKIISNGEEGIVFGAYVYTDIHADNIEGIGNEAGLGLTLLDTLGFEIYAKVIGIGAKLSIKKDNFSLFANLDINLVDDVTASIGYVNKLKNGDEVEDSYEIRGNIFAVIAVIYFIYTGAEMPAGAQPNGGKIPGLN